MFSREKLFNLLKIYFLNKYFFLICGTILAYNSSIEVLDLNSNFWLNDQSKFYKWATKPLTCQPIWPDAPNLSKLIFCFIELDFPNQFRYGLFVYILSLYSFLFNDPFFLVFTYKISLSTIFIFCFYKSVIINYGFKVFIILFISFSYLNLFLLRDSLLFLVGLTFVINFLSTKKIHKFKIKNNSYNHKILNFYKYSCLLILGLIRPQSIFVYLRPILSIGFLSFFIIFLIVIKSSKSLRNIDMFRFFPDIGCSTCGIGTDGLFHQFIKMPLISLYNINPIPKFKFYFDNSFYIEYVLLFISSFSLLLLLYQIILSLFRKSFYFEHRNSIITGLLLMLFIYSQKIVFIDIRIFISLLAPFFLFLNKEIFNFKIIICFLIFLISIDSIKTLFETLVLKV